MSPPTSDDSDTTDHSVDHDEYMEGYSDDDIDGIARHQIDHLTDNDDSEMSSGYMGYMPHHGQYYDDYEDESLDFDHDPEEERSIDHYQPYEYLQYDPTPSNPYPKPDWTTLNELRARKCGFASSKRIPRRQNMFWFQRYASNSLWMIQRLQERKMPLITGKHPGIVYSIHFNSSANLICSGGDQPGVCIWDWKKSLPKENILKASILSGHNKIILQSQFCNQDTKILTSSRDGSVRLIDIEKQQSERLFSTSGEIGKSVFINQDTFLTCGTNASVNLMDVRSREARKLFTVRSPRNNRTCSLHSIESHPIDKHVIAVAGSSPYVFLYDLRRLPLEAHDPEIKPTYNLGNFENPNHTVTSTAFNSRGDKLLISYNDDDLYVCRTDTCEIIHKYQGHRNEKGLKSCAWFGDNFVLSGSDDGHIYGWDLESEHIVCFLQADRRVVDCLVVHPDLPIIASSGSESDISGIKIWEPVADTWPQTMTGIKPQICKNAMRKKLTRERRRICQVRTIALLREDESEDERDEGQDDADDEDDAGNEDVDAADGAEVNGGSD